MQVIPKDQTSTLPSYCPSSIARITSGAILEELSVETSHLPKPCQLLLSKILGAFSTHQYGVPTKELAGAMMDAEPKSPSFTKPGSESRMFPAFTSLPEEKVQGSDIYISGRPSKGFSIKFPRTLYPSELEVVESTRSQSPLVLSVPMDHVVGVQISQTLKGPMGHSCNLYLLQGLLVHWESKGITSDRES